MADATYQPLVYRKQGSTEFVVASSGLITVESGGEITIESGGTIDVESGGGIDVESGAAITLESGGKFVLPVTGVTSSASGSTTLTTLPVNGLSCITSSADVRLLYLPSPYLGADKYIRFSAGSTQTVIYLDAKTNSAYFMDATGTNTTRGLLVWEGTTNGAAASMIHLMGYSTTKWMVLEMESATSFVFADTSS